MSTVTKTDLSEYWMPFSNNRGLKGNPKFASKLLHRAKGVHYYLEDGTELLDGMSGLWCVNAGHGQEHIINAVKNQLDKLDYASCFNVGHPLPFEFSRRLLELLPGHDH